MMPQQAQCAQPVPQMTYAPPPQVCAQPQPQQIMYAPPPQVCVQPQPIVQMHTQMRPVMETQYRQEQYTVYRDVPRTDYRVEQQAITVPVTSYRQVTVDEGNYQQVWVPKMVSKMVPQTAYQQQMVCKTVPVQTTQRVAEVATRTVPVQSVRYVPQTYQTVTMQPACGTCTTGAIAPGAIGMNYPYPATAAAPVYPYAPIPQTSGLQPTYDPITGNYTTANNDPLTPVKSRHQKQNRLSDVFGSDDEQSDAASRREQRRENKSTRAAKRFTAPSAATVWQAQGGTSLR